MTQQIEIKVPISDQNGSTHVLSNWLKQPGDTVTADAPLVDLETDKVMVEVAAPASGVLKSIYKKPGDQVEPGTALGLIEIVSETKSDATAHHAPVPAVERNQQIHNLNSGKALLSPAVRRLVKEHRLDLQAIDGSGKRGRVTKQDVLAYLEKRQAQRAQELAQPEIGNGTDNRSGSAWTSTHIPHSGMRRRIAEHMSQSLLHTAPHVTSIFEVDLSNILRHREQHKAEYLHKGIKLTLTAYFVAAAVKALQHEPSINSRFHEDSLEVIQDINIGIGTALQDQGLIVPVIQRAHERNLLGIASELQRLTELAHSGELSADEIKGGTFTISNHGVSGSLVATPIIINQPQTAILGIGKVEKRVVVREIGGEDSIMIRPMAYITLTIDHRAIDAYQTNRFLSHMVAVIESWSENG